MTWISFFFFFIYSDYHLTLNYYKIVILSTFREIRECLKLDPEHKQCFPHYKKVKKIAKFITDAEAASESKDYESCIESSNKVLKNEPNNQNVRFLATQLLCRCYLGHGDATLAIESCGEALDIQRDSSLFCDRADAYIAAEQYDDGRWQLAESLMLLLLLLDFLLTLFLYLKQR